MNEIHVSIIMPAHNAAKYIRQALDSVLAQTYSNWELLLVNDGSNDTTFDIAKEYAARDKRVILIETQSQKPIGVARARELAINAAQGRYIGFLDSDDWWQEDKLQKQVHFMQQTGAGMTHHDCTICTVDGVIKCPVISPAKATYHDMLLGKRVWTLSVMIDTQKYGKPSFAKGILSEDLAGWLYLLRKNAPDARSINVTDARGYYRLTCGSLSSQKIRMAKSVWHILRSQEKLPLPYAAYCFFRYALHSVLKRKFR
jgi:teichuronic acid biosynthesis glycosyltransferase TuaG